MTAIFISFGGCEKTCSEKGQIVITQMNLLKI